jgi:hypothetical protein
METSASSGRTKRLFHRKSIATIDSIEHVLNVANSYLAYGALGVRSRKLSKIGRSIIIIVNYVIIVSCGVWDRAKE